MVEVIRVVVVTAMVVVVGVVVVVESDVMGVPELRVHSRQTGRQQQHCRRHCHRFPSLFVITLLGFCLPSFPLGFCLLICFWLLPIAEERRVPRSKF